MLADGAAARLDDVAITRRDEALHLRAKAHLTASLRDEAREHITHAAVVDDAGLRDAQSADTCGVRFDLSELFLAELLDLRSIGDSSLTDLLEGRELRLVEGDHDLAAELMTDAVLLTKVEQGRSSLAASLCLQRAGLVVDA